MTGARATKIEMIPIDKIAVVNPRSRGRTKFRPIVDNIASLGLKKPITVTPRSARNGGPEYDLVCGQGRLEAFQALGQTEVPAFIVDVSKDDLMLMSLAENLARRVRSAPELLASIATLKDQGYSDSEIAEKTDLAPSYVKGILRLLSKGEERLLRAVEAEQIPITVAVTIASADEADVQKALAEAYAKNTLRGKDLLKARKLVELRRAHGKRTFATGRRASEPVDGDTVLKKYEQETARQRNLVKQARLCESRLLFVVASLRKLLADPAFVTILRDNGLSSLPEHLAAQVEGKKAAT